MRSLSHRRRRARRQRAARVALGSAAVLALVVAGLAVTHLVGASAGRHPATTPDPPTVPTTTSTTSPAQAQPTPIGAFSVGTTSLTTTAPAGTTGPGEAIPVEIWFPAADSRSGPVPDHVGGPHPLLVFSQGYDLSVQAYTSLIGDWASAGFVVAAPTYPHTDPADPGGLDEEDIVNHPADLRAVITDVVDAASKPGSPLAGMVDTARIGLVGHSDGGDVSLAVAANTCCRDQRVKAVAVLSGAELASFGGTYFAPPTVPILVVQGSADIVNVPACSTQIYDAAPSPKYYLDLLGAAHEPPYVSPGPVLQIVAQTTTAFFDATLAAQASGIAAMSAAGTVAGTAQLTVGGTAPPATGTCPGAPA